MSELRSMLRARLAGAMRTRSDVTESDIDDFTQDACIQVLRSLDSFRGDSRFETWATAIAIRAALTAIRRRRFPLHEARRRVEELREAVVEVEPGAGPERRELYEALRAAIKESLTPRQRQVILGELAGVPQVVLADVLDATPNAIYKTSHDARRKLRDALERAGFDGPSVRRMLAAASKGER